MSHLWYQETIRGVRALEKGAVCDVAEGQGSPVHPCPLRALLCASYRQKVWLPSPAPLLCAFCSPHISLPQVCHFLHGPPAFSASVPQDVSDRHLPPPRAMHTHHPSSSCLLPPATPASSLLPPEWDTPPISPPFPLGKV